MLPTQQIDLVNTQLVATQQQLHVLQERYNELSVHHSMLLQELIGVQKTVVNHEHVMQYVMNFLQTIDAQRRRESRVLPFAPPAINSTNGTVAQNAQETSRSEDDTPASPLQNAAKLLSEVNADQILNSRNLEHMNEVSMRYNNALTTPPPDLLRNGTRSSSRGPPHSATSSTSGPYGADLENMVYPIGHTNGIDPMYSEHINNIPYPMPAKPAEPTDPRFVGVREGRKKSTIVDPGWIKQPQVLLVEDDTTCRRIGSKFLFAFHCSVDSAVSKEHSIRGIAFLTCSSWMDSRLSTR